MNEKSVSQRYGPTSGFVTGLVGLICCAVIIATAATSPLTTGSARVIAGALLFGVLVWAFMLRPRIVIVDERELLLRNPLTTVRLPLAAVRSVGVKTVTSVRTEDEQHYECVAVGYPLRSIVRGRTAGAAGPGGLGRLTDLERYVPRTEGDDAAEARKEAHAEQKLMQERILLLAEQARARGLPVNPVERRYAVAELGALAVLAVTIIVTFVV